MKKNQKQNQLILHLAREPRTGVWSLMKELAIWQEADSEYKCEIVIFAPKIMFDYYNNELSQTKVKLNFFPLVGVRYSYWLLLFDKRFNNFLTNVYKHGNYNNIIIQIHNANLSGLFLPIKYWEDINIRIIAVFHGTPLIYPKPSKIKLFIHKLIGNRLKKIDKIVSVSKANVNDINKVFSYKKNQFEVVPNGVADPRILHIPNIYPNNEYPFLVGFVGSFEPRKRVDLVIEAVEILFKKGLPVKAVLVGFGGEEQKIKKFANENNEWLDFKGYIPDAGINIIPRLDVLVLPSSYEGLPMTIIESLACGVPIIATSVSDIPDIISDPQCGYLVTQNKYDIAQKIEILVNNHIMLESFSRNAREKYIKNFSIETCGKCYNKLYSDLFSKSHY